MNTEQMGGFLRQVSLACPEEHVFMIVDGASSHVANELVVPENMELYRLPPCAPELNAQEHIWDEVREKEFPNRVFDSMDEVISQLKTGLPRLSANRQCVKSITLWPWIKAILNGS